jgi:hypothetical protein
MRSVLIVALLLVGCGNPALDYARQRNRGCAVVPLERRGDWVRVEVRCPGQAPKVRAYGR